MGSVERFITHYVWYNADQPDGNPQASSQLPGQTVTTRLQNRLNEMLHRRRRLIKYQFKKENKIEQFETVYPSQIQRKEEVIKKFTDLQLEELLNNSTKNVA